MKRILILDLLLTISFIVNSQKIVYPYYSVEKAFSKGLISVKYIATEELVHALFTIENKKLDSTNVFIDKGTNKGLCAMSPNLILDHKVFFRLSTKENDFIILPQKGDFCIRTGFTECKHIMDFGGSKDATFTSESSKTIDEVEYAKLMEYYSLDIYKSTIEKIDGSEGGHLLIKRMYNFYGVTRRELVFDSIKVNELYKNLTLYWNDNSISELKTHEFKAIMDENGNFRMVSTEIPEIYILDGIVINESNQQNYNSLLLNLTLESSEFIEYLIERGADINYIDSNNNTTPLILAIRFDRPRNAKLLIEKGADINFISSNNFTPLMFALRYNQPELAKILIEKGADINTIVNNGNTPLMFALISGQRENAKLLIKKGADINARDDDKWTPLMYALRFYQPENAKLLIENKVDINAKDNNNWTPLMIALRYDQPELAKLLIESGADVNIMTKEKNTPLMYASMLGQTENVKLLLEKGANINAFDNNNWTPLFYALLTFQYETAKLLLENGADINVMNNDNETPLMYSCRNSKFDLIMLLLTQDQVIKKGILYKKLELNSFISGEEKAQIKEYIKQK